MVAPWGVAAPSAARAAAAAAVTGLDLVLGGGGLGGRGAAVSSVLSLALASRRRGLAQTTLRLLTLLDPYPLDPQHLAARAEDLQGTPWLQASVAQAPRTMQYT